MTRHRSIARYVAYACVIATWISGGLASFGYRSSDLSFRVGLRGCLIGVDWGQPPRSGCGFYPGLPKSECSGFFLDTAEARAFQWWYRWGLALPELYGLGMKSGAMRAPCWAGLFIVWICSRRHRAGAAAKISPYRSVKRQLAYIMAASIVGILWAATAGKAIRWNPSQTCFTELGGGALELQWWETQHPLTWFPGDWETRDIQPTWLRLPEIFALPEFGDVVVPIWLLVIVPVGALISARCRPIAHIGSYCPNCRYDLSGNQSGVCPECGRNVRNLAKTATTVGTDQSFSSTGSSG